VTRVRLGNMLDKLRMGNHMVKGQALRVVEQCMWVNGSMGIIMVKEHCL